MDGWGCVWILGVDVEEGNISWEGELARDDDDGVWEGG